MIEHHKNKADCEINQDHIQMRPTFARKAAQCPKVNVSDAFFEEQHQYGNDGCNQLSDGDTDQKQGGDALRRFLKSEKP